MKMLIKSIQYAIENYDITNPAESFGLTQEQYKQLDELVPSVLLPLQSDNLKDLRQQNKENSKRLDEILSKFERRYTTKSNQAIYQLMTIALRAELQNILTNITKARLLT